MTTSVRSAPDCGVGGRRTVRASEDAEPSLVAIPAPGRDPSPSAVVAELAESSGEGRSSPPYIVVSGGRPMTVKASEAGELALVAIPPPG